MSIMIALSHLAASGSPSHDMMGPMELPRAGPTLPMLLKVMLIASAPSMPNITMTNVITATSIK